MIEIFNGTATLCSVAKQCGLNSSLALDKVRKKGARATIFVFDILNPKDKELLYHWLESPLPGLGASGAALRNMFKGKTN